MKIKTVKPEIRENEYIARKGYLFGKLYDKRFYKVIIHHHSVFMDIRRKANHVKSVRRLKTIAKRYNQ